MQLYSQKTFALLWCATFFLWLPLASHETSDTSNGLERDFDPGLESFEDGQSSESTSARSSVESSTGLTKQIIEPSLRRHLEQRSTSSEDEDDVSCTLSSSQRRQFYSTSTQTWNITDVVLEGLDGDIQIFVSCAAPGDVILLPPTRRIQPRRSVIISKNLTISAQPDEALSREDPLVGAEKKVNFSCPSRGDLFVIRSGVILANLAFTNCNGTGNVLSIEMRCDENSTQGSVHLQHLQFKDLTLSGDQLLLDAISSRCAHLSMESVILRDNTCGTRGCMSLSQDNTLRDIQVSGNQVIRGNVILVSPSVFVLPMNSTSVATNMLASGNSARVFSATNSYLTLKNSHFDGNTVNLDVRTSIGGSVLVSNFSTINVEDSHFRRNFGLNGGAIYAQYSTMFIRSSTFQENRVVEEGSAIYFQDGSSSLSLEDVDITNNSANLYGTVLIGNSVATLTRVGFFENSVTSYGGGLSFHDSNITVQHSKFENNSAGYSGGAIYAGSSSNLDVLNTMFKNNSAQSDGGGIYAWDSNVFLSETKFTRNNGDRGGGCYFNVVEATLHNLTFFRNRATDGSGGGVCIENGTLNGSFLTFEENLAIERGGGGFLSSVSATMRNLTFCRNRAADGSGGGLYIDNGKLRGELLTFRENRASELGGGIYGENSRSLSLSEVRFDRNNGSAGGGIAINNTTLKRALSCNFTRNHAVENGGSVFQLLSQSSFSSCHFKNSTAQFGGSLWIGHNSESNITLCIFNESKAGSFGGGIEIRDNTRVWISNSSFSSCQARRGGALRALHGDVNIENSTFERNDVGDGTGGAMHFDSSTVMIRVTNLSSNNARNYAGIHATNSTSMNATTVFIQSNVALKSGGGIGIENGASLLCRCCQIINNTAEQGAGMTIRASESMPRVAQLQDSTLASNTASHYGGGLFFMRPTATNFSSNASTMNATSIECNAFAMNCNVALLNTTFKDNVARVSGSAILTSDPCVILVSCNHTEPQYDFMDRSLLRSLHYVHPKNICRSWTGNRLKTANPAELNVSTFGRDISFSSRNESEIRVTGNVESGFIVENVTRGDHLPMIYAKVLDAYGNGPTYSISGTFEATMESPYGFSDGNRTLKIIDGSGSIPEIFIQSSPGNYTIKISPNVGRMQSANIQVRVRKCVIGEELSFRNFCEPCNAVSYNFNPTREGECTPCPNGATCETRYIVPQDGYWHKSPCHANVTECLIEEACTYGERQHELKDYSRNFNSCDLDESMLKNYNKVLCRDGYRGPLCGSCNDSYGLSVQFKCLKCPHAFRSFLRLMLFTLYLLVIASVTIRGGLPLKLKKSRPDTPSESLPSRIMSGASLDEQVVSLEMVAMISQDQVISNDMQENDAFDSSTAQPSNESNEPELTRWITTEVFKVTINFLQVTSAAASINVEWTEDILKMFEVTEYVGALSSDALSGPIDCLISSDSASIRSIWRSSLNLLVPIVVMAVFVAMWGFITHREKKGESYFWKRVILSVNAVTYIAYLGLTKLGVRVFYCVDVYDSDVYESDDYSSTSRTRYWAVDTSIKCYKKGHVGLLVISVFVLLLVSLSFPLISAIYLFQNKAQPGQMDKWTHETMGFLYRAFKEKYVFWESLVMLRKACLSLTVVFAYPLGGQSQGLLALGVVVLCLYLQQTCFPYRAEFHKLNYYESGSLLVSSFTFILGQFFSIEQCTNSAKILVEVLILTLNASFFTFLLVVLFKNGMNHIRAVLKFMDYPINDNTSWWRLLKLFIKFKKTKATLSQD